MSELGRRALFVGAFALLSVGAAEAKGKRRRRRSTASRALAGGAGGLTAGSSGKSRDETSSGSCPCSGSKVCVGPRGGRYCITSGGNKRYGV